MSNAISGSSFNSAQSIQNNHQSSHESRELFNNDKCAVHHHGGDDFSMHDKQSGQSHRCQGDFGQGGLEGSGKDQGKLIEQIVQKILDKIGQALGIDLSGLGQQNPGAGGGHGTPGSGCRREDFPPLDRQIQEQSGQGTGGARSKPDLTQVSMPGDFLQLGNAQNVKDHNPIERALDPFGIF
jgi:hypothetical protein